MDEFIDLDKFLATPYRQEIELQQLDHDAGGMSLMRIRIRERSRFTVFEIDPVTARDWGEAMTHWAARQLAK